jgi:hypothetical protein
MQERREDIKSVTFFRFPVSVSRFCEAALKLSAELVAGFVTGIEAAVPARGPGDEFISEAKVGACDWGEDHRD